MTAVLIARELAG